MHHSLLFFAEGRNEMKNQNRHKRQKGSIALGTVFLALLAIAIAGIGVQMAMLTLQQKDFQIATDAGALAGSEVLSTTGNEDMAARILRSFLRLYPNENANKQLRTYDPARTAQPPEYETTPEWVDPGRAQRILFITHVRSSLFVPDTIEEWGREAGYPVDVLLPHFLGEDNTTLSVPGDGHPNVEAHRRMAGLMFERLRPLFR